MATPADVLSLLDHERRRAIACAALDAPATIGEIATQLGVADGAIRSTVERLVRDELLVRSDRRGDRTGKTAAQYQVDPAHAPEVRERCRGSESATLDRDREILLVPLSGLRAAATVLARGRPPVVGWAVRTPDPQLSLIIGLRLESPPEERDALLLALRESGADCGRVYVGEAFSPPALFGYAEALTAGARPALPG